MPELVFTSWWQFTLAGAVLLAAQVVYVVFGFGSGLIAVGSLALVFPEIRDVVVLLLLVNLPAEIGVTIGTWKAIRWREALGLFVGIIPGVAIGAYVLKAGSPTLVLTTLGIFLLLVSALFLLLRGGVSVRWPRWVAAPTGLLAGALTGLFGTGGPPLIVYYHLSGLPKRVFRGNLMALFFAMTVLRVLNYGAQGLLTAPRLWSGLLLLPVALVGAWLGQRIHLELSEALFRRLVSALLGILGLLLVARNLDWL